MTAAHLTQSRHSDTWTGNVHVTCNCGTHASFDTYSAAIDWRVDHEAVTAEETR